MVAGLGLRVWGLSFGLPNLQCRPDETTVVNVALGLAAGDLNPHFFNYPTFHLYVLALADGLWYLANLALGCLTDRAELERQLLIDPSALYLLARSLTAALGTATLAAAYALGRRVSGDLGGILAAAFLAVAFLHVRDSHFATVDVPATFYATVAWVLLLRYADTRRQRDLLAAAALLGVAAATKYTLAVFGVALVAAPWLAPPAAAGPRASLRAAAGATVLAVAAFCVATPFCVLDFTAFWRDFGFERLHFARGHAGVEPGSGWWYHLTFTLSQGLGWPLALGGGVGLVWLAAQRCPAGQLLLLGGLAFFLAAGSGRAVFMRYLLPLVPLLCVGAAASVVALARQGRHWGAVAVAVAMAAPSGAAAWQHNRLLGQTDTRLQAASWIEAHIPSGSTIALVGSDYGMPQVRRSRATLLREQADLEAAGQRARRLDRQLALPGYPPLPAYTVVHVQPPGVVPRRSVIAEADVARLHAAGIQWVVTQEHVLAYSQVPARLAATLSQGTTIAHVFDPFVAGAGPPVYDLLDAYYVPVGGFAGVSRPGPRLIVYRLAAAGPPPGAATLAPRSP
jgi:hypothetical protein